MLIMTRQSLTVTRRAILAGLLGLSSGCGRGRLHSDRPGGPTARIPAIDTHTHFYDPTRPQGVPWPPPADRLLHRPHLPDEFTSLAAATDVVGTVVVEASPWLEDNQWLLDLAGEYPVIVGIVGNLSPGSPAFPQHLARFARDPLFRGIRLGAQALANGLGASGFDDDVRRLADTGSSMDLLGGAAMIGDVARLARLAPQLPIVIDHLPFADWDADAPAARRALQGLVDLPNVYAKVSGVLRPAGTTQAATAQYASRMDLLWEMFGERRVLYASNWPVSNRLAPYEGTHRVVSEHVQARGRAAAESFFWRNSLAVYRWVWRGATPFPGDRP